jgi:hypothetical protein
MLSDRRRSCPADVGVAPRHSQRFTAHGFPAGAASGTRAAVRDDEFRALTDWLAEGPAGTGADTAEGELAADWQRSVTAARWARLAPAAGGSGRRATAG